VGGAVVAETGYADELRRSEKNVETAENRVRNLKELIASLGAPSGDPSAPADERLQAFLEDITLDAEREEEEEQQGDAVTLITVHSCKGLEFPHVYVVGLEEGLLPHARSKVEGTIDEERRLFYVAITRAMKTLTLSHCLSRKKYGQNLPCHPSSFLKELPPNWSRMPTKKPGNRCRREREEPLLGDAVGNQLAWDFRREAPPQPEERGHSCPLRTPRPFRGRQECPFCIAPDSPKNHDRCAGPFHFHLDVRLLGSLRVSPQKLNLRVSAVLVLIFKGCPCLVYCASEVSAPHVAGRVQLTSSGAQTILSAFMATSRRERTGLSALRLPPMASAGKRELHPCRSMPFRLGRSGGRRRRRFPPAEIH